MAVYRHDQRRRFTLVLLVVTSLLLISLDQRGSAVFDESRGVAQDIVSPLQGALDDLIDPAADFFDSFAKADELEAENARLRRRNATLRIQVERAVQAVQENAELRDILDIRQIEDYDGIGATVVSGSVDNFHRTWRIDKGSSSGIEIDMPVVVGDGSGGVLVGRVASVASNRAVIERVDDRSFAAGAQLVQAGGPGPIGSVEGIANSRLLTFRLFERGAAGIAIGKGDLVVTTGLEGSNYPKGLLIGNVLRAVPATAATARDIRLVPIVDLDGVDIVKVLRYRPAAR